MTDTKETRKFCMTKPDDCQNWYDDVLQRYSKYVCTVSKKDANLSKKELINYLKKSIEFWYKHCPMELYIPDSKNTIEAFSEITPLEQFKWRVGTAQLGPLMQIIDKHDITVEELNLSFNLNIDTSCP